MYARHESARTRQNAGGYGVLVLVAAVVVTASAATSCTNLAATPTTAPAPATLVPWLVSRCPTSTAHPVRRPRPLPRARFTRRSARPGGPRPCGHPWRSPTPSKPNPPAPTASRRARLGELDHKIALGVGGDPGNAGDVANLWFEPDPIPNPKDIHDGNGCGGCDPAKDWHPTGVACPVISPIPAAPLWHRPAGHDLIRA